MTTINVIIEYTPRSEDGNSSLHRDLVQDKIINQCDQTCLKNPIDLDQ